MKFLLVFSLIALASCGKYPEEKKDNSLGETITPVIRPVQPGSDDYNKLKIVCNSLDFIQGRLHILVSNHYSFLYATKSCGEEKLSSPQQVAVSITYSGGEYVFSRNSGGSFPFPYVAANANGAMEEICHNLGLNLKNPLEIGSQVIAFTTEPTSECQQDQNHICVSIKQAGSDRMVHTSEWMKLKVYNERRGFFVERGLYSSADCGDGEWIERWAKLL